jgi:hypothetical protein
MRSALTRLVCRTHACDVSRERERRHDSSFAGRFSQGLVDPLLPAGAAFLEEFENILVDAQGDELLREGDLRRRRHGFDGLPRHRFERGFRRILRAIAAVAFSWWHHHFRPL